MSSLHGRRAANDVVVEIEAVGIEVYFVGKAKDIVDEVYLFQIEHEALS